MIPRINPIIALSFVSSITIPIIPNMIATEIINQPIIETRVAIVGISKLIKETKPAIIALANILIEPKITATEPKLVLIIFHHYFFLDGLREKVKIG